MAGRSRRLMSTRGSRSDFCAGGFDDGSAAATTPLDLWIGAEEGTGEPAEERGVRTGARQRDADARGTFHDACSDLDEMQSERLELGAEQRRFLRHCLAQGEHEPIRSGMQDQTELVGFRIAARGTIGSELGLVQLDEVLGFAARTIDRLIVIPGATLERGDDVADIETFRARLQTLHLRAFASPALGAVSQFLVTAQLLFPTLGALDAERIGRLADHSVHKRVAAAEAKNVRNPLVFAPFHLLVAAIVAVPASHRGPRRPVLSVAS